MGGRRATSVSEILGAGRSHTRLVNKLDSALTADDTTAISAAASQLATKVVSPKELDSHLALLVPYIRRELSSKTPSDDLRRDVRREWSRVKKEHNVRLNRVVSEAVVQGAIDLLRRAKK